MVNVQEVKGIHFELYWKSPKTQHADQSVEVKGQKSLVSVQGWKPL